MGLRPLAVSPRMLYISVELGLSDQPFDNNQYNQPLELTNQSMKSLVRRNFIQHTFLVYTCFKWRLSFSGLSQSPQSQALAQSARMVCITRSGSNQSLPEHSIVCLRQALTLCTFLDPGWWGSYSALGWGWGQGWRNGVGNWQIQTRKKVEVFSRRGLFAPNWGKPSQRIIKSPIDTRKIAGASARRERLVLHENVRVSNERQRRPGVSGPSCLKRPFVMCPVMCPVCLDGAGIMLMKTCAIRERVEGKVWARLKLFASVR